MRRRRWVRYLDDGIAELRKLERELHKLVARAAVSNDGQAVLHLGAPALATRTGIAKHRAHLARGIIEKIKEETE